MEGCAAARLWRSACTALDLPDGEDAWKELEKNSPPDSVWHSLRNCVAYQAGVWQNLLAGGMTEVTQPAAFRIAVVMRHTPSELTVKLLAELLRMHPDCHDLTSYILSLLTDDEWTYCGACGATQSLSPSTPPGPAPLRDLKLFGDSELAVLAASREEYDAHAKLVRAEYSKLTQENYVELRLKVLNQFMSLPRLFHTSEYQHLEPNARENIEREIITLREHLLTGQKDH